MDTGLSALTTKRGEMIYFPKEMSDSSFDSRPELRINFAEYLPYSGMQKEIWNKVKGDPVNVSNSSISGVIVDDVSVLEWAAIERKNKVKVFIGYVKVPWKRDIKANNDVNSPEKYTISLKLVTNILNFLSL